MAILLSVADRQQGFLSPAKENKSCANNNYSFFMVWQVDSL
jgi:hypothetical protein